MTHQVDDESVIARLQERALAGTPVEVAELLEVLAPNGLTQGAIVTYFKRAFPDVPLPVLLRSGTWQRVSTLGQLTDAGFDDLLGPWLDQWRQNRLR